MPTTAQRKELERAAKHPLGLAECRGPVGGLARSSWERKMRRLCEAGLFTRYVHGGYEITHFRPERAR